MVGGGDAVVFGKYDCTGDFVNYNAYDYKAVDEPCSQPVRTTICLNLHHLDFYVRDKGGVTVRMILDAIAKHWAGPAGGILESRNGWTGWYKEEARPNGSLYLKARYFDS